MTDTLVLPSTDDPVVGGAVEAIGGRPGRHARVGERRFWNPVRVLVVLTLLTSVFGYAQKLPCRDGSNWVNEYQYTRACYTDVIALYGAEGLSDGKTPYYQHPVEYPVVIGAVMQVSSLATKAVAKVMPDDARQSAARRAVAAAKTTDDRVKALGSLSYADGLARSRYFYDLTWLVMTACALVVVVATARTAGRRPWDAALFALAPGLLLHGTTNWDLLAMALAALGLLSWARRRPVLAGVWFGLATATKLYPILFLAPLLFLCLRAGKFRAWLTAALATVIMALAVTAPIYLTAPSFSDTGGQFAKTLASPLHQLRHGGGLSSLNPLHCDLTVTNSDGSTTRSVEAGSCPNPVPEKTVAIQSVNSVYRFFQLNKTRGADWDSLYFQAKKLHTENGFLKGPRNAISGWLDDTGPVPSKLNRWVAAMELLVIAGLGVLILAARRRPRLPQVLFLGIVGFLLANKVDSPQYVLWLLPLAALANPRWRPFLAWQAAEVFVLGTRFYFFIGNDKPGEGISQSWFFAAVLLRDLLLLVFSAYVVRDIWRPDRDPVRADGQDDPAGGVLDGAPDRRDALA